ncbi:peptidylprolyl isomerase [Saccharobesus litoralis]|nr:peptidylprolyl isomerase [Saccharobesus litoralis]
MCASAQATIVKIETNMGDIEVNLFDETTPKTVKNFLWYVNNGDYDNAYFHRSVRDFIIQTGSFRFSQENDQTEERTNPIATNDPVENEPIYSNIEGTIAMAKIGGQENSATAGWFFNLDDDNDDILDTQNGGFTVFGQVVSGLDIVQNMGDVDIYKAGGAFDELPLQNYDSNEAATRENLVIINKISIIDPSEDSAKNLSPVVNTEIYELNKELITNTKSEIEKFITEVEGYKTAAETAKTAASSISSEKAEIADTALTKIEETITELNTYLAPAEQYIADLQAAENNNENVLSLIPIRVEAMSTYSDAFDAKTVAKNQLEIAQNAAKQEDSGGGSLSALLIAAFGLLIGRRRLSKQPR